MRLKALRRTAWIARLAVSSTLVIAVSAAKDEIKHFLRIDHATLFTIWLMVLFSLFVLEVLYERFFLSWMVRIVIHRGWLHSEDFIEGYWVTIAKNHGTPCDIARVELNQPDDDEMTGKASLYDLSGRKLGAFTLYPVGLQEGTMTFAYTRDNNIGGVGYYNFHSARPFPTFLTGWFVSIHDNARLTVCGERITDPEEIEALWSSGPSAGTALVKKAREILARSA